MNGVAKLFIQFLNLRHVVGANYHLDYHYYYNFFLAVSVIACLILHGIYVFSIYKMCHLQTPRQILYDALCIIILTLIRFIGGLLL